MGKRSYREKKWALASDYIRLHALYTEGGIYLDTDVMAYKPLNEFLKYDFFTSVEYHPEIFERNGIKQLTSDYLPINKDDTIDGLGLLSAAFGSAKGNQYIKECMDYYKDRHFIKNDGSLDEIFIIPAIMSKILINYGFRYKDEEQ